MPPTRTLRPATDRPEDGRRTRCQVVERAVGLAGLRRRPIPRGRRHAAERLRSLCRHVGLRFGYGWHRLAAVPARRTLPRDPRRATLERAAPRLRVGPD